MRNLACGDPDSYLGGLILKLIINDWVHVFSELVLKDRGRMVKWHVPI